MEQLNQIKDAIEDLGKSHHDYRETNDARLKALEKGDTSEARRLQEKLDKIDKDVSTALEAKEGLDRVARFNDEQKARLEQLEARLGQPGVTKVQDAEQKHADAFEKALRGQFGNVDANTAAKDAERSVLEAKAVTIASPAGGGYAVPEVIARDIEKLERKLSPVRDLVKVRPVGTSDYKELVSIGGAASGWVGESGTRSETGTPQLREVSPTHGELYAYPQASEWSLDDAFFNIADWLRDEVAEEFAYQEGIAVISGDGSNKPTGMLNTTPVTTDDAASPLRAAAAYEYVDSPNSPAAVDGDTLIDMVYLLNAKYRSGARWVFNSITAGAIRKLKDSNGQYHWQPGLAMGEPSTLLGFATTVWEDMAAVAASAFPIAFGNFQRGYLLADRVGMRITVDQVTNPGFIRYYIRRREGGIPLNNDAIKFMRT